MISMDASPSSARAPAPAPADYGEGPVAEWASDFATRLLEDMAADPGEDALEWGRRAVLLLDGLMPALVRLCAAGRVRPDMDALDRHLRLDRLVEMGYGRADPELADEDRARIRAYLERVPGFSPGAGARQSRTTRDGHGYLRMRANSLMCDEWGWTRKEGGER